MFRQADAPYKTDAESCLSLYTCKQDELADLRSILGFRNKARAAALVQLKALQVRFDALPFELGLQCDSYFKHDPLRLLEDS